MDQTLLLHWDRYLWSTSPMMRGSLFRTSSRRGGLINPKGQLVLIVKSSQSADLGSIWGDVLEVWDAACLRLEYYWMQVASLSRNVDGLAFFHIFLPGILWPMPSSTCLPWEWNYWIVFVDWIMWSRTCPDLLCLARPFRVAQWGKVMKWFGLFQTRRNLLLPSADDQGTKWDST